MTKEVSIFAKTPFSSVTRGDVDTEEIITQEEYELLKQRIERVMNCKLFFQSLGRFRLGVGVSFSADTPVTGHSFSISTVLSMRHSLVMECGAIKSNGYDRCPYMMECYGLTAG